MRVDINADVSVAAPPVAKRLGCMPGPVLRLFLDCGKSVVALDVSVCRTCCRTLTDQDPNATILSVDGVGAFDLVSRNAMLQGLLGMEDGDRLLPFVRLFHGDPSTFLWEDDSGGVHHIHQGEGGEQGDHLMPMLFSLGKHAALTAIAERLEDGERLLAFLDDLHVVTTPLRAVAVHEVLREELWRHAKISVHHGKTCIWNRGGVVPDRCDELEAAARAVNPRARVWRGNHEDSLEDQGITILGTPVGWPEFVERELAKILANHSELLTRIPEVQDLQCAWLLLLYCGDLAVFLRLAFFFLTRRTRKKSRQQKGLPNQGHTRRLHRGPATQLARPPTNWRRNERRTLTTTEATVSATPTWRSGTLQVEHPGP